MAVHQAGHLVAARLREADHQFAGLPRLYLNSGGADVALRVRDDLVAWKKIATDKNITAE